MSYYPFRKGQPAPPEKMLQFLKTHVRPSPDDSCLRWAGVMNGKRPYVKWQGQNQDARRLMVKLSGRSVEGLACWTSCGERGCMNPAHVRLGTHAEMSADKARLGAYMSGAARSAASAAGRSKGAKLPVSEARTVRVLMGQGLTRQQVAQRYGCSVHRVAQVLQTARRLYGAIY